ncbi:DUF6146 family protein [Maribacter chungangensis]|uniref:DUF6146 family protein n=1 Tax=Maribacter chungangensis TaxID=1069117 RepID=A0ABW3B8W1_9FLAO
MKKKNIFANLLVVAAFGMSTITFSGCGSTKEALSISEEEKMAFAVEEDEPVTISNEDVEYEITIIDPGFFTWLNSVARPPGYYSQTFLENRNILMVLEWNQRVLQPNRFNPDLYLMQIDYQRGIDYGYDVNYQLYNYFIFFQRKYNQRLGPFVPRI